MTDNTEIFVGIDVAKVRNAIAIADGERGSEVRFLGEVDASEESMRRVVKRITEKHSRVLFCYEAGPTGYGLHRLITSLGHTCIVVAPSLTPRKPGDHVKTNRRDAISLAKLLRAGELTAVWVPDEGHEAMRDLVRARAAAVETLCVHRQQVSAFMLKHGRIFPRKKGWTMRYLRWLQEQKFDHPAHQIVLLEMVEAVRLSKEQAERVAYVLVAKFAWHLPLYRQAQMLLAQGLDIKRAILAFWVGYAAAELKPLYLRLRELILASGKIAVDETVAPVLDPGRGRTKKGYFSAMARDDRPWGGADPPAIAYTYTPGRGAIHALKLLEHCRGIVQCDGYAAYKTIADKASGEAITLAFRWAHLSTSTSPRTATLRSQAKRSLRIK
jgi:transposase